MTEAAAHGCTANPCPLCSGSPTATTGIASWSVMYSRPRFLTDGIRIYPHPDLKAVAVANPADESDERLSEYLDSNGAMDEAGGVAIAANQTGRQGRFWVMKVPGDTHVVINATVEPLGPFEAMDEGCLSLPGQYAKVMRSTKVRVIGYRISEKGLAGGPFDEIWEGQAAQVAQHENDHLNGKVFIDHLKSAERSRIKGNLLKAKKAGKLKP